MGSVLLDSKNRFIFNQYAESKPFASFLPGIAGPLGIPMWAFYVNRGQAIASFGVESKDAPLMEFQPANKAYQLTPTMGFRTFLKLFRHAETTHYEPFAAWQHEPGIHRWMATGLNELEIEESNPALGLKTSVLYYTLPGEVFAGLVRRVTLQNSGDTPLSVDLLDGMPALIPYGVNNGLLKDLGRTVEAWMAVFNLSESIPFYRLAASVVDRVEVEAIQAGHFALALHGQVRLAALVDPAVVFGADTGLYQPQGFYQQPLADLLECPQVTCGRTPCAFFAQHAELAAGESITIHSLYGHVGDLDVLNRQLERITQPGYFEEKYHEAADLADALTATVATHSADALFDAYCRQNYLDNVLRGGLPVILGKEGAEHVYSIYSRKHGDLERDYNAFYVAAEPYSQGEGSYRDVNQNRRDNILQNPLQGDADIRTFMSLIGTDGYNPRTLKGSSFTLSPEQQARLLDEFPGAEALRSILAKPFTPGILLKHLQMSDNQLARQPEAFLSEVISRSEEHIEAAFFEGYWIDHWEYNLDLIENYLAVFPERREALLFGAPNLPFYESAAFVQPRSKKYILLNGAPRQVGSLLEDAEKEKQIAARSNEPNWTRTRNGQGEIYHANLFAKMTLIALLKFATLDPAGMGIEMEAGRPGWYDALNGLPALFGSGMSESYELLRWITFLRSAIRDQRQGAVRLPVEAAHLLADTARFLADYRTSAHPERDFMYWDAVSTAREAYREQTRLGIDGDEQEIHWTNWRQPWHVRGQRFRTGSRARSS